MAEFAPGLRVKLLRWASIVLYTCISTRPPTEERFGDHSVRGRL